MCPGMHPERIRATRREHGTPLPMNLVIGLGRLESPGDVHDDADMLIVTAATTSCCVTERDRRRPDGRRNSRHVSAAS